MLLLIPCKLNVKLATLQRFTIHFATINTTKILSFRTDFLKFTIHFATINTKHYNNVKAGGD